MKHRLVMTVLAIIASLTLAGSVATAAVPVANNSLATTPQANPPKPDKGKADQPHGNPHANQQGDENDQGENGDDQGENGDDQGENGDDQGENEPSDQTRPHNHGWYVSQAAHDKSTTGADHGKAVSEIARGDDGKTGSTDH